MPQHYRFNELKNESTRTLYKWRLNRKIAKKKLKQKTAKNSK